jgi:hypothetical protein
MFSLTQINVPTIFVRRGAHDPGFEKKIPSQFSGCQTWINDLEYKDSNFIRYVGKKFRKRWKT